MASGTNWRKDETLKLLDAWGQENVQAQLEGCKKNQAVYEKISTELQEAGYERTYQQCRDKIKKLKGDYRKAKDKKNKTGTDNRHWDYFEPLDAILGHKPATQPPIIIDTAAELPLVLEELNDDLCITSPSSISTGQSDSVPTPGQSSSPATPKQSSSPVTPEQSSSGQTSSSTGQSSSTSQSSKQPLSTGQSSSPGQSSTPGLPSVRKRKRPMKNEGVVGVIEQLIEKQTQSDIKMMELEEKRMQLEERILEREAQQRREDREFQMKFFQMLMGHSYYPAAGMGSCTPGFGQNTNTSALPYGTDMLDNEN